MIYLAVVFLFVSIILFVISARQRQKAGMPVGKVIYSDTNRWVKVEDPLYDKDLRLTGKPDYLVKKGDTVIPVEVKSGRVLKEPPEWHIYQLAAYCLLTDHEYGVRPTYGIINYPGRTYAVDFTQKLEQSTREIIRTMQSQTSQIQVERSHHDQYRCLHCGYRAMCDQALRI